MSYYTIQLKFGVHPHPHRPCNPADYNAARMRVLSRREGGGVTHISAYYRDVSPRIKIFP